MAKQLLMVIGSTWQGDKLYSPSEREHSQGRRYGPALQQTQRRKIDPSRFGSSSLSNFCRGWPYWPWPGILLHREGKEKKKDPLVLSYTHNHLSKLSITAVRDVTASSRPLNDLTSVQIDKAVDVRRIPDFRVYHVHNLCMSWDCSI